jgi:hypothetical protein
MVFYILIVTLFDSRENGKSLSIHWYQVLLEFNLPLTSLWMQLWQAGFIPK